MSEKAHNRPPRVPNGAGRAAWAVLGWLAPLWLALGAAVCLIPRFSPQALDTLALGDAKDAIRVQLDGLRLTRGLLRPPGAGAPLIWQGRDAPGFFLAGAVDAERRGRPAVARLWLALALLDRGDAAGGRRMLEQAGGGGKLPESIATRDPATWGADLTRRLEESLK